MIKNCKDRTYSNDGNWPLLQHLPPDAHLILDIGCGAGDNAALLKAIDPEISIFGITVSTSECEQAGQYMTMCVVADIELGIPEPFRNLRFDGLIFSHVLEHLRDPATVLATFGSLLKPGGVVIIAVPNVLTWKQRWQFLVGRFEYTATGIMDNTHLRFFTYATADKYLLSESRELTLISKDVTGSVPLWMFRRHLFSRRLSEFCDVVGCRLAPNLFGSQIIVVAQKKLS